LTYNPQGRQPLPGHRVCHALPRANAIIGLLLIGTEVQGGPTERRFSERQFLRACATERGRDSDFQRRRGTHAGYTAADVMNKITPADISDPQELIARAKALSVELATTLRRASRHWCSKPRAASRTSMN